MLAGFLGASSTLMPTLNEKFPPPHGTDSAIVSASLQICGVTIMVALLLTLYGLLRRRRPLRMLAHSPGEQDLRHGAGSNSRCTRCW